jgi:hypothetical protein
MNPPPTGSRGINYLTEFLAAKKRDPPKKNKKNKTKKPGVLNGYDVVFRAIRSGSFGDVRNPTSTHGSQAHRRWLQEVVRDGADVGRLDDAVQPRPERAPLHHSLQGGLVGWTMQCSLFLRNGQFKLAHFWFGVPLFIIIL